MENINLLDKVYLPQIEKEGFRNSKAFKLLDDKGLDTSQLEGYEEKSSTPVTFDAYIESGGTKEDWIAKHVTEENKNMFFGAIGDFVTDLGKDGLRSIAVGATNGVDFAVNLAPVLTKLYDLSPIGVPAGTLEASGFQEDFVAKANAASEKLGEAREFLKNYKDDGNVVSKIVQVMGQDLMYSIPIYNKLKSVGVPTIPSLVISGGVGGAIGIEKKLKFTGNDQEQYNSTFTQDFFGKDIAEIKRIVGILPNTPYDEIADEVTQALEYGAFSYAIPKLIQGFQFMKKNIPYFAGGAAAVTMTGDDAEASPLKAITNAVFKSSVKEAAEKKITSGSGEQILNTLRNTPGVKYSEIKWIGLDNFLVGKKNVSQAEVLKFIDENRIDVTEVMFPRKGKDFGMYNDMLESAEQRQVKLMEDYFNEKGIAMNNDQYPLFNKDINGESLKTETLDFSSMQMTDIGRNIDSFQDVNTFIYDVDAIKDIYPSNRGKNYVEFYLFEDDVSGKVRVFGKSQFEDISPKEYKFDDPSSGGTYNFSYSTDMSVSDLQKYAAEGEVRRLKQLRSQQEGTTRYEQYTEPGGSDYKELIFKFRQRDEKGFAKDIPVETGVTRAANLSEYYISQSPHFNEFNEIAHVRFKTRYGEGLDDNKKILSVEEMQSDLVQAVKKSNQDLIEDASVNLETGEVERADAMDDVIKDFPFKNNWYELTLKRLIRYSADNGFDAISIPKGSVIQDRYNLTRRIDDFNITYFDEMRKEVGLMARDQNGVTQIDEIYSFDRIKEEFGDDVLDRVLKKGPKLNDDTTIPTEKIINEADLYPQIKLPKTIEIGGEGKNQLYNKTIPAFLKKYGKKWNAKVYDDNIPILTEKDYSSAIAAGQEVNIPKGMPVTIIEITPEMKKSVQETSQPLFSYFGGFALGAEAVSETIQNNIISEQTN